MDYCLALLRIGHFHVHTLTLHLTGTSRYELHLGDLADDFTCTLFRLSAFLVVLSLTSFESMLGSAGLSDSRPSTVRLSDSRQ
jgi:hypothetical protein